MKRNLSSLNLRKTLFFLSLNALNIKVTLHLPNAFQCIVLLLQARQVLAYSRRAAHFASQQNYRRQPTFPTIIAAQVAQWMITGVGSHGNCATTTGPPHFAMKGKRQQRREPGGGQA
jgi:hypothetical protein